MAFEAGLAAELSPPAVAVHDDSDVTWEVAGEAR
jgi:hypothetical protein